MKKKTSTSGRRVSRISRLIPVICAIIVSNILVSFLILKNEGKGVVALGPRMASAESGEKGADKAEGPAAGGENKAEGVVEETAAPEAATEARKREGAEAKIELEGLEEKRIQIRKQQEGLRKEQEKLKALKQELSDKITELEKTHQMIEESLIRLDKKRSEKDTVVKAAEDKKIKQLVKAYSSMKPKQAGAIINNMDIVIAEKLFLSMKGEVAGRILAYVESSKAALISERIAMSIGRSQGRP